MCVEPMKIEKQGLWIFSCLFREMIVDIIVVVTPFTFGRIISFVDGVLSCLLRSFKHCFGPCGSFGNGDAGKNFFVSRKWMLVVHIFLYIIDL